MDVDHVRAYAAGQAVEILEPPDPPTQTMTFSQSMHGHSTLLQSVEHGLNRLLASRTANQINLHAAVYQSAGEILDMAFHPSHDETIGKD